MYFILFQKTFNKESLLEQFWVFSQTKKVKFSKKSSHINDTYIYQEIKLHLKSIKIWLQSDLLCYRNGTTQWSNSNAAFLGA